MEVKEDKGYSSNFGYGFLFKRRKERVMKWNFVYLYIFSFLPSFFFKLMTKNFLSRSNSNKI